VASEWRKKISEAPIFVDKEKDFEGENCDEANVC